MTSKQSDHLFTWWVIASGASLSGGLVVGFLVMYPQEGLSHFGEYLAVCAFMHGLMPMFALGYVYLIPFISLVVGFSRGWLIGRKPIMLVLLCLTLIVHGVICAKFVEALMSV